MEPQHLFRDETDTECRSEVVQLGFRVADKLAHEQVYPVDYPLRLGNDALESLRDQGFKPDEKVSALESDPEQQLEMMATRLQSSTVSAFHRWLNQEEQLGINDESLFDAYLRWGENDNFGGPRVLSTWYDRNIRIVHNVWRAIEPDDERVLLLVGNGHVPVLRHLFATAPLFCPVSPLPHC
ncbi:DUF5694 domain-containing protein [Natrialba chahannaoensis]|uniref:DUF5694 domain-containing protein n=1 Tax=Natrialba chahannaoensis TaxID=68911 RepID=UPI00308434F3